MPTSPKATTMPGGAPLSARSSVKARSSRPCKYGPRDEDGRCPKKPRAAAATRAPRAAKAKPPCKYGPRDADGHCPKKPKSARAARTPSVRDYESVKSAARQAGQVLRSKKATKEQKHEAVKVLGSAVAGEATKKVAEHVAREVKKAARTPGGKATAKAVLKKAAAVAGVVPTIAGIGATLYVGAKALKANRSRECRAWAKAQLAATKKRLTEKLTPQMEATLLAQYEAHCNKKPVTNPFLGK